MNGGERIAEVLKAHGVPVLYTLCGGHISPILVAAKARGIRVVDTRHEATAVFAADAVARLTGIPGVAAVTAGPGITNAVTALRNAQLAQSPLVLLGGAAPTALQGRGALQDIDAKPVVAPQVKRVIVPRRVADLAPALEEALIAHCRERLIKWSCPREVEFIDELPLTRVGKVDYRELTRRHAARATEAA